MSHSGEEQGGVEPWQRGREEPRGLWVLSLTENLSEAVTLCALWGGGEPASICVVLMTGKKQARPAPPCFLRRAPSRLLHDTALPFILDFEYRRSWVRPISSQEDMARAQ